MFLAIDIGNTHTVIGVVSGMRVLKKWRISTHPHGTADEFLAKIQTFFLGWKEGPPLEAKNIEGAVVGSVVPSMTDVVRRVFSPERLRADLVVVDYRSPFSFTIKADSPWEVGVDRLLNAEAAVREGHFPAILVDSGTATTVCAVNSKKEYLGGAIMSGIELSIEALARRAAKLFEVELKAPEHPIGSNTEKALRSGIILGYASMVDGMVNRFKEELVEKGESMSKIKVIATGGIGKFLSGVTKEIQIVDEDLTLKGLAHVFVSIPRK